MIAFLLVGAYGAAFMTGTAQLVVILIGFALFIACFAIGIGAPAGCCRERCSRRRCPAGVVFVCRFLPETKGKSVEQVVELFNGPVNLKDPSQPTVPMR